MLRAAPTISIVACVDDRQYLYFHNANGNRNLITEHLLLASDSIRECVPGTTNKTSETHFHIASKANFTVYLLLVGISLS